jgi:FRG domain
MKNDIKVKNWPDLLSKLYKIPKTDFGRHRSDFVYRGVADKAWGLETSLKRLGGAYIKLEGPLLRSFKKYAQPGSIPSDALWFRLSVAQHHGLPTRLLDWTVAPKVAVHFATAEEEHYDKDAAIWCIDVVKARALLPEEDIKFLHARYAWLFDIEMLDTFKSLADFDSLAKKHGNFVLFFEPPSLDGRIVNQGAIMSVMPGADLDLGDYLKDHPELYRRFIIPKRLKWEIRDMLDQDNVTERMLFPGLDGLSRWLKRYYGPGPNKLKPPNDPKIRRIP